jgi:hypothetical protein
MASLVGHASPYHTTNIAPGRHMSRVPHEIPLLVVRLHEPCSRNACDCALLAHAISGLSEDKTYCASARVLIASASYLCHAALELDPCLASHDHPLLTCP